MGMPVPVLGDASLRIGRRSKDDLRENERKHDKEQGEKARHDSTNEWGG